MLLYRVAKIAIADPRLQALSIYAYCLLWDIAHESHRILTHSNLMIVAIAATVLMLLLLVDRATFCRYLFLGFWIGIGLLSKFGFAAFLSVMLVAALAIPRFRILILDRRIMAAVAVTSVMVGPYWWASASLEHSIPAQVGDLMSKGREAGFVSHFIGLLRSAFGYVVPLLPIVGIIFFRHPATLEKVSEKHRDIRRFLTILISVGMGFAVIWAVVIGTTQLRPRYFHALLLLYPILHFAWLDRYNWPLRRLKTFLAVSGILTFGIMIEQVYPLVAPSERLFGSCRLGIPYDRLGVELEMRFGKTPTLVALDVSKAGQLRAAVPGARVVTLSPAAYRPPYRKASPCVIVWLDEATNPAAVATMAGISLERVEAIDVPWFQPMMREQRFSRFYLAVLPESSELCR
jgi:hypothetical protein